MSRSISTLLVLSSLLSASPSVYAQFHLDVDQLVAAIELPEPEPVVNNGQNLAWGMNQNIDAWIFNRHQTAAKARRYLENQLDAQVAAMNGVAELTHEQRQHILLAGTGDIARFFSQVDVIRDEFKGQQANGMNNQIFQRVQPLQQKLQKGLFQNESMFAMVSKRTLDEKQLENYQDHERKRIREGYFDAIKLTISELEKSAPMTSEQRQAVIELLKRSDLPKSLGQYTHYYVLYQLSKKKTEVNKILDEKVQNAAIQRAFQQGRGMQNFLKQNGFL